MLKINDWKQIKYWTSYQFYLSIINYLLFISLGHDVSIWTGTHGVLQYADKSGNLVDIYLYTDGETQVCFHQTIKVF